MYCMNGLKVELELDLFLCLSILLQLFATLPFTTANGEDPELNMDEQQPMNEQSSNWIFFDNRILTCTGSHVGLGRFVAISISKMQLDADYKS